MGKTIGILNKGEDNVFINNKVSGFDVAVQNEGRRSFWKDNKLGNNEKGKWYNTWWG